MTRGLSKRPLYVGVPLLELVVRFFPSQDHFQELASKMAEPKTVTDHLESHAQHER
jgi:hypothetical protein